MIKNLKLVDFKLLKLTTTGGVDVPSVIFLSLFFPSLFPFLSFPKNKKKENKRRESGKTLKGTNLFLGLT